MIHRSEVFEDEKGFSLGWKGRLVILTVALLGLGFFLYQDVLRELISSVLHREGSSHGLFVPFISGYLLWLKRERIRQREPNFSLLPGCALIVGSFFLLHLSRGSTEVALPALSFLLATAGLIIVLFGMGVFKELSFPLLFLVTMIPLPETIYDRIGEWMRQSSTVASVWLTKSFHLPIYREGYSIHLPNTNLFVDMSCSGIRALLSYFVFSLAYVSLFKKSFGSRILVVSASLPLSFAENVLRLSILFFLTHHIGAHVAAPRPHILLGWFLFLTMLIAAIGMDRHISRLWAKRRAQRIEA